MIGASTTTLDGFGVRSAGVDAESGDQVELLEVAPELVEHDGFVAALAERVARFAAVRHTSYVHLRRLDRPEATRLQLVSDFTPGWRLSELFAESREAGVPVDINVFIGFMRQLLPAVALYARHNREAAIGTLAPERLIVTPQARLVIAEHAFGPPLERLNLGRDKLWRDYRVMMAPSVGLPRANQRADAMGIGGIALSLLLGRVLSDEEFPSALESLVDAAREHRNGQPGPVSPPLANWLKRALQLEAEKEFQSPSDAQLAFETVLISERSYVMTPQVLEGWVNAIGARIDAKKPEPVALPEPPSSVPQLLAVDAAVEEVDLLETEPAEAIRAELPAGPHREEEPQEERDLLAEPVAEEVAAAVHAGTEAPSERDEPPYDEVVPVAAASVRAAEEDPIVAAIAAYRPRTAAPAPAPVADPEPKPAAPAPAVEEQASPAPETSAASTDEEPTAPAYEEPASHAYEPAAPADEQPAAQYAEPVVNEEATVASEAPEPISEAPAPQHAEPAPQYAGPAREYVDAARHSEEPAVEYREPAFLREEPALQYSPAQSYGQPAYAQAPYDQPQDEQPQYEQAAHAHQPVQDEPPPQDERVIEDERVAGDQHIAADDRVVLEDQVAEDEAVTFDEHAADDERLGHDELAALDERSQDDQQPAAYESSMPESAESSTVAPLALPAYPASSPEAYMPLQPAAAPNRVPMLAMAGVIVLLLIAVGYFATRGGGTTTTMRDGEVAVTTRNPGANVKIDGKPVGVTPVTISLSPGPHVVEVQMGDGEPRVVPVMIRSGVQTAQYVELPEPLPPQKIPPEKTRKR